MKWIKSAMPFVLLLALLAWAAWHGAQVRELATDVKNLAEKISALQSQQEALQNEAAKIEFSPIISYPKLEPEKKEFEPLDIPLSESLQKHTISEAERVGIEPAIIFALMYRESRFDTEAWRIDSNGYESVGLCQINGITSAWMKERGLDPSSPEGNITAACELIGYFMERYTHEESLAAYGAGVGNMLDGYGFTAAQKLILDSKNYM